MRTISYETMAAKKREWGDGPWNDEPDKMQWQDEATGLPCLIVRNRMGTWCGYVGVPEGHPAYGVDYDDVRVPNDDEDGWPSIHGGLTFANKCSHGPEESSICHVPEPGEPDNVWWLGFDCAHLGDLCPSMIASHRKFDLEHPEFAHLDRDEDYRDIEYARSETRRLAAQLASAADSES